MFCIIPSTVVRFGSLISFLYLFLVTSCLLESVSVCLELVNVKNLLKGAPEFPVVFKVVEAY